MGSLFLFVLGVAAPLAAAIAFLWNEERRRLAVRARLDRMAQDNRGLKLALGVNKSAPELLSAANEAERREADQLIRQLAQKGALLDTLRSASTARAPARGGDRDAAQLQQALADWGAPGLVAALDELKGRLAAVAEMEMVWADPHADVERDSLAMLERSLWVFEPEYVVGEGRFAVDQRFGAVAKPTLGAGLYPGLQAKDGEPTLVVDLKSARTTVGADQQLQAWNNVRDLIRGGAIRERDPVDVYVVGGAVDELDGNPRVEGRYRNVRITSYDYGQLIARAKRLTFGLYDTLKERAPFLVRHREEIMAAQRRAAEAAASEASQSHQREEPHTAEPEPAPLRPQDHFVRHDAPASAPAEPRRAEVDFPSRGVAAPARQPQYEGEHIVIGTRRHAAQ